MNESLKIISGITMLVCLFAFFNVLMFGLLDTSNGISVPVFSSIYFLFCTVLFFVALMAFAKENLTKSELIAIGFSLLVLSAGLSSAATSLKIIYDDDTTNVQDGNILQQIEAMKALQANIMADNMNMANQIDALANKIKNQSLQDAAITINSPPEAVNEEAQTPQIPYDYEYEYEEDDD